MKSTVSHSAVRVYEMRAIIQSQQKGVSVETSETPLDLPLIHYTYGWLYNFAVAITMSIRGNEGTDFCLVIVAQCLVCWFAGH